MLLGRHAAAWQRLGQRLVRGSALISLGINLDRIADYLKMDMQVGIYKLVE
jgi:hypothetical protein